MSLLGSGIVTGVIGAETPVTFLTGPRFAQQLDQPVTATWSNLPFREAMASFSSAQRVAVLIDRRLDGDNAFSLVLSGDPLRAAVLKIAERKHAGSSIVGPVVYFGPRETAAVLRTLLALRRDEVGKYPAGVRKLLTQSRPWECGELSEPRKLIADLGKEARIEINGLDRVPHDLWPATRLPALPWCDRLTLLVAQFGLTYQVSSNGQSVSLVPIPDVVEIERTYPGGEQPSVRVKKLATLLPTARISLDGDKLVVRGRMEDHDEITQFLSGKQVRTTTVKSGQERYKLNVEGMPLEKTLGQLGTMLKLDVRYEREAIKTAGVSLDQLITFHVEDASLDELLTAAFKDTGLTFERRDNTVMIRPVK